MVNNKQSHERIARLEEHREYTDERFESILEVLDKIKNTLGKIELTVAGSKGFIAGLCLAFSAIGSLFILGLQAAAKKMGWI